MNLIKLDQKLVRCTFPIPPAYYRIGSQDISIIKVFRLQLCSLASPYSQSWRHFPVCVPARVHDGGGECVRVRGGGGRLVQPLPNLCHGLHISWHTKGYRIVLQLISFCFLFLL